MGLLERIQVPYREEIMERAAEAGVPEAIARYLGDAGGESRAPEDIYGTVNFLTDDYVSDAVREEGIEAASLPHLLLEHYPGMVVALVPEEGHREEVMTLWDTKAGQRQWLQTVVDRSQARTAA